MGGCGGSTVPVTTSSHDRHSASSAGSYLDAAYLCNGGKAFRVSGARVERGWGSDAKEGAARLLGELLVDAVERRAVCVRLRVFEVGEGAAAPRHFTAVQHTAERVFSKERETLSNSQLFSTLPERRFDTEIVHRNAVQNRDSVHASLLCVHACKRL